MTMSQPVTDKGREGYILLDDPFNPPFAIESIQVKVLSNAVNRSLLQYQTNGAAGMDLCANGIFCDKLIGAGERALIPTGLRLHIPPGFEGQIRPRSGLALEQGITVLNTPGTIDSDYRGEIKVLLINLSKQHYYVKPGTRIAQIVFARYAVAHLIPVEDLEDSERGERGFGSTGV